jgi:hypothetical protein
MGIHLVRVEHPDTTDEPQVVTENLSGFTYEGNYRIVTDLVLVDGRYVAIEHLDDGDGPLLEDD